MSGQCLTVYIALAMSTHSQPAITQDARFRAGRALIERGQCEQAVTAFATLLEEARNHWGDDHFETVPAYYEYGNALFRAAGQDEEDTDEGQDERDKDRREAAAAAAERRAGGKPTEEDSTWNDTEDPADDDDEGAEGDDEEENDIVLALEMMETAWAILDRSVEEDDSIYEAWTKEQTPRILVGIGDVLSSLGRHADAADVYCRAQGYRQADLETITATFGSNETESPLRYSVDYLQCRRRLVEVNVLIAEELLACPPDEDVITTESKDILVKGAERIDYARGYYDKARDELQETVLLMGEMAAKGKSAQQEKENVCFVATMVMGVGTTLAELEEQIETKQPAAKRAKTS